MTGTMTSQNTELSSKEPLYILGIWFWNYTKCKLAFWFVHLRRKDWENMFFESAEIAMNILPIEYNCFEYETLTVVIVKISILWDVKTYRSVKVTRRFGGTCHVHFKCH
jgi:hypothetical protein